MIKDLLLDAHTIAFVGLEDNPGTRSFEVASYIQSQGYDLVPVNPDVEIALGHAAVDTLDDVKQPVDIVNVMVQHADLSQIAEQASTLGAKAIWVQPHIPVPSEPVMRDAFMPDKRNLDAGYKGPHGIRVIKDRCIMDEHRRLLSDRAHH